jgi:F1F0 ATPase subunit 2
MDEQRMTHPLLLPAYFTLGGALGWLYFHGLWWNVRRFTQGGRMGASLCLGAARFLGLAAVLYLTSRAGALPLLVTSLGLLAARVVVLRRFRREAA